MTGNVLLSQALLTCTNLASLEIVLLPKYSVASSLHSGCYSPGPFEVLRAYLLAIVQLFILDTHALQCSYLLLGQLCKDSGHDVVPFTEFALGIVHETNVSVPWSPPWHE